MQEVPTSPSAGPTSQWVVTGRTAASPLAQRKTSEAVQLPEGPAEEAQHREVHPGVITSVAR